MLRFCTHSVQQTEDAAACIAPSLAQGAILLLHGGLGAGKTAFVRGLARGLGADENEVSSPTFSLMNQYEGRLALYHFDLYRISGPDEMASLGFDEYFYGHGVSCIEWPSRAGDYFAPGHVLHVTLCGEDDARSITLEGFDDLSCSGHLVQLGFGCACSRPRYDLRNIRAQWPDPLAGAHAHGGRRT